MRSAASLMLWHSPSSAHCLPLLRAWVPASIVAMLIAKPAVSAGSPGGGVVMPPIAESGVAYRHYHAMLLPLAAPVVKKKDTSDYGNLASFVPLEVGAEFVGGSCQNL